MEGNDNKIYTDGVIALEEEKNKLEQSRKKLFDEIFAYIIFVGLEIFSIVYFYVLLDNSISLGSIFTLQIILIIITGLVSPIVCFLLRPLINILDSNRKEYNKSIDEKIKSIEYRESNILSYSYAIEVLRSYINKKCEIEERLGLRNNIRGIIIRVITTGFFIYFMKGRINSYYKPEDGWIMLFFTFEMYVSVILVLLITFVIDMLLKSVASKIFGCEDEKRLKKDLWYLEKYKNIVLKKYTSLYIKRENGREVIKDVISEAAMNELIYGKLETTEHYNDSGEYIGKSETYRK